MAVSAKLVACLFTLILLVKRVLSVEFLNWLLPYRRSNTHAIKACDYSEQCMKVDELSRSGKENVTILASASAR